MEPLKSTTPLVTAGPVQRRPAVTLESTAPTPAESFVSSGVAAAPAAQPALASAAPEPSQPSQPSTPKAPNFQTTLVTLDETPPVPSGSDTFGPRTLAEEIQALQTANVEVTSDKAIREEMRDLENRYLKKFPYHDKPGADKTRQALKLRYADHRVSAERVHKQVEEFAKSVGVDLKRAPEELHSFPFDASTRGLVRQQVDRLVDRFFASDEGSQNPLKAKLVKEQSQRFVDLIAQAQQEGDAGVTLSHEGHPKTLSCEDVYQLVSRNVAALALQDRAACENTLGDHGVRHLVGHNIQVCEKLLDELERNGGTVTAKDRLILHQGMIMHDLGYSTQNVRGGINYDGVAGQDAGHPLLGGRYIREVMESVEDPCHAVFSASDFKVMHRCVMYHDVDQDGKSTVDIQPGGDRTRNLESITRLADNTHAFEDKLPEILYRNPESLKMMRLMKAAGEVKDEQSVNALQARLCEQIDSRDDLSDSDKEALKMAANKAGGSSLDFTVRRILGNRPQYEMDPGGKVTVTVEEAKIHGELMGMCGQDELGLLEKYIKDVSGTKVQIRPGMSEVDTPSVRFQLKTGPNRAQEMTEFQGELSELCLEDKKFRGWATQDIGMAQASRAVSKLITMSDDLSDADLAKAAGKYFDPEGMSADDIRAGLIERRESMREERAALLEQYLKSERLT